MNVTIEVPQDVPTVVVEMKRASESGAPREDGAAEYDSWARNAREAQEYDSWARVFNQDAKAGG